MEVDGVHELPDKSTVLFGHQVCQTNEAKWLRIDKAYQKCHRSHIYDIGGTYDDNMADYWFTFKTEQVNTIHLMHLFVCNRQESKFNVSISQTADMTFDKKNGAVYLSSYMKELTFPLTPAMSQNYLTTYSFSSSDLDFLEGLTLFIAVSFGKANPNDVAPSAIKEVKFKHDFSALLEDPLESDFVIESADGAKFQVHQTLLGAHSDVFKTMFDEEMAEKQNGYVKLVDVEKEDVQSLLEYIYTGTLKNVDTCNCFNLLMLSDKYNIKGLRELSSFAAAQQVSVQNAIEILAAADMYNSEQLKVAALMFIKRNASLIDPKSIKKINNPDLMAQLYEHVIPTRVAA